MDNLRTIVDETLGAVMDLGPGADPGAVRRLIEQAVLRGILEGHQHAHAEVMRHSKAEQDEAHRIASEIQRRQELLITNLASLR